jgi:integrase
VDGAERIVIETQTYYARYRDHSGLVVERSTGCRDEAAARQVLAEWERQAERIRVGVLTAEESRMVEHQARPIGEHIDAFDRYLAAKDASAIYRSCTRQRLDRLAAECEFSTLADLRRDNLERWLAGQAVERVSAKTRNHYRGAVVAFCNWCVATDRLTVNPFAAIPKANEKADRRRQRRAMEESELARLLDVARHRPLLDRLTVRRGRRAGEACAKLGDATRERQERLGRERALIYKTLVLTGLRKAELASLTVGQLLLDGSLPCLALAAADEKNREGNEIVLREDLAEDLLTWLADKLSWIQAEARKTGKPIPARLPAEIPLFTVPAGLLRILNRDLRLAGIPKRDERGRTLDVHALRTTFGTLLSKGGVAPRTAQAAMRHSDIRLTMEVYTDPKLLDVRGALDVLPTLPLEAEQTAAAGAAEATGTTGMPLSQFARQFAGNPCNRVQNETTAVPMAADRESIAAAPAFTVKSDEDKRKGRLSSADNRPVMSGRLDSNQRPHGPEEPIGPRCHLPFLP